LELGPAAELERGLAAIVSIKDYPAHTSPGMLDDLLRIPAEMVVSQSFAFVDREASLSRMNLALRRMRASDDEAFSLRNELAQAKDDVAAGRASFGEHHLTLLVRGSAPAEVNAGVAEVQSTLTDLGIISVREDLGLEAAFWAQFPGNFAYIARRALIGSANFASLTSGHNFPLGSATGNHWGDAVAMFETTAAGPYHFNFHHGDLGNFTVIGPSGSGKTVIVNFLLAQARRFHPRIVFFDKDRGAELFIRAIGGVYDELRPGTPSCLNPLLLPDTAENRRFLLDWFSVLAGSDGAPLSPEETAQIKDAVDASYAAAPAYRRMRYFVELLRGGQRPHAHDLYSRMRAWWGDGEHAWLFDNAAEAVDLSQETVGFDMTRLLDSPTLRTPAMMYLFHRVDERLDGTPSIIVVDEGWKALDDEIFVARIRDWEKTIRKRNGIVGFVTQNAEDALSSRISSAIVEQAATQIFTPNPKANAEDYVGGFGLTQHEYDLIRNLPDTSRCFLVKHGLESVVIRLNLSGEADLLTILSGRERTVRLFDEIRARTGDNPAVWLPELVKVA
jgi:type IV secretion system protein VirB4